jgi:hypothetical protein
MHSWFVAFVSNVLVCRTCFTFDVLFVIFILIRAEAANDALCRVRAINFVAFRTRFTASQGRMLEWITIYRIIRFALVKSIDINVLAHWTELAK